MQKSLNNRLEDLETEINSLLKLQTKQCSEIQNFLPILENNLTTNTNMVKITNIKSASNPSTPHHQCQCRVNNNCNKIRIHAIPTEHPEGQRICICGINNRKDDTDKVQCNSVSTKKDCICGPKNNNVVDCSVNEAIDELKLELNNSKARTCAMAKEMTLLTDALQIVRNKYKDAKQFRKEAATQLTELKHINTELCRKLENEIKAHATTKKICKMEIATQIEQSKKIQADDFAQERNKILEKGNSEFQTKIKKTENECISLRNELNEQSRKLEVKCRELEDIVSSLNNEKNKNTKITKAVQIMENKMQEMTKTNKESQTEISTLKGFITNLQNKITQCAKTCECKEQECQTLRKEYETLNRQTQAMSLKECEKCRTLQNYLNEIKQSMTNKEALILEEKETLKKLVQELSDVVRSHRNRIKGLIDINKQQDEVLHKQMILLRSKDEQIKHTQLDSESTRQKCHCLEDQIHSLQNTVRYYQQTSEHDGHVTAEKLELLQNELKQTRRNLQEEKEKLLIKEKVINDQADTICSLKNNIGLKGNKLKKNDEQIAQLQKQLEEEISTKEKLQDNIHEIRYHKDQLKIQITELETEFQNRDENPVRTQSQLETQKKLLQSLERQVELKQREWTLQCQLLNQEKDNAVKAARAATEKLLNTVRNVKVQNQKHERTRKILTDLVHQKDEQIKCASRQIEKYSEALKQHQKSEERLRNNIQKMKNAVKVYEVMSSI